MLKCFRVEHQELENLFKMAKSKSPSIIFIDEIDAIGEKGQSPMEQMMKEKNFKSTLTEMDGFGTNHHVIFVAATNKSRHFR